MRDIPTFGWILAAVITARLAAVAGVILSVIPLFDGQATAGTFARAGVLLLAAALLSCAAQMLPGRFRAAQERRWRARLAAASLEVNPDDDPEDAQLIQAATDAAAKASTYTISYLGPMLAAVAGPAVVLLLIGLGISWPVAGLLLLTTLVVPLIIRVALKWLRSAGAAYGRAAGGLAASFLAGVRSLRTALVLTATAQRRAEIADRAEQMRSRVMGLLYRNQLLIFVTDGAFGLTTMTVAAAAAISGVCAGTFSPATAVAVVLMAALLIEPVNDMGRTFYTGASGRASLAKIQAILERPARPGEPAPQKPGPSDPSEHPSPFGTAASARPSGRPAEAVPASLEVSGLSVSRGGATVLTGAEFTVPAGGHLAVVGPSGAGKTSLLLALAGLIPADGRISVNGRALDSAQLRLNTCYVPQSPVLFTGSLAENLDLAGQRPGRDRLERAATGAALEMDLDRRIGETRPLSGGETARVALARGLLSGAGVLLLDEPTANLDARAAAAVRKTVKETGLTIVEITHRVDEVADADDVIAVRDGRIVDAGEFLAAARRSEMEAR